MKRIILKSYNLFAKKIITPILNLEQRKPRIPQKNKITINERPVEYAFSFKHLQKLCTGKILDIGPGTSSFPHSLFVCGYDVKAVDKMDDYWSSYFNRHFKIINDDITKSNLNESFQFITCLSVLEHIPNHRAAIKGIHNLLEKNGYLILTVPYNEKKYHENIYKHNEAGYGKDYRFITQVYSRKEIEMWLTDTSFKIVEQEFYKIFTGELWTFGERVIPSEKVDKSDLHHLTCILLQKTEG